MAERKIRVDQAHCNYHLARHLQNLGFEILYTDAGRTSRGGTGIRGAILNVFEARSWPIPDIVALNGDGDLLVIEIDNPFAKAAPSLLRYHAHRSDLQVAVREILTALDKQAAKRVRLGYCRMGLANSSALEGLRRLAHTQPHIDDWYAFTAPGTAVSAV